MRKILMAATGLAAFAAPAAAQQAPIPDASEVGPVAAQVDARIDQWRDRDDPRDEIDPRDIDPRDDQRMDPRDRDIVRAIPQRGEIEAVGDVAARSIDAILSVPIGPLIEAANPGRRLSRREREETLGDRAARSDPYVRERMRDQIAVASIAMGALAEQMAVMTPVLRRTLEDAERRVEDAARGIPPRDYDRGYDRRDEPIDGPEPDDLDEPEGE
jgi:hypothetical protein